MLAAKPPQIITIPIIITVIALAVIPLHPPLKSHKMIHLEALDSIS